MDHAILLDYPKEKLQCFTQLISFCLFRNRAMARFHIKKHSPPLMPSVLSYFKNQNACPKPCCFAPKVFQPYTSPKMLPSTPHQSQNPPTSLPPPPPHQTSRTMKRDMATSEPIKATKQDVPRLPAPPSSKTERTPKGTLLPPPRRTNPVIWCAAFACVIFSLLLILAGIAILIIFLVIKPRHPSFDTTSASLNTVYLDTTEYLNGDLTFLANFSNPNHKIDIRFEYLDIELYFFDRLIGKQYLQPFAQRRQEARLESVHMISSEVYLPVNLSMELQKQVQRNRIQYNIRGTFRVRATLGLSHFSYWLYGRCQIELTGPPTGVLITRSCRTKK